MRTRWARTALGAVAVAALLLTSACNSGKPSGSTSDAADADAGTTAKAAADTGKTAIFVIGGKSDDPFWSKVKRGVDDAAKVVQAQGGSVTFLGPQNYDNLGPDAAKLIDSALSQGATAVIGPDWVPEAEDAAFKRVVGKGVPLILYNAGGIEAADRLGALNYIGSDEYTAGKAGGEFLGKQGAKNVLCVNTLPGAANTESRCRGVADGVKAGGGNSKQLPMPSSNFGNPTAVAQGIKAALLKDDTIDGVVTISTPDADSAASGIQQAGVGDKVKLGTFDMDESQLSRIKDGKQLFSIDQQPYMQGYLAVSMANGYLKYGLELPQRPLLTGPAIISADNVDSAIAGAKAGVR
ncbi:simple sugar transport system substrate-binding protein [Kribbella steppae]|uniref:Simple sugar transport system substrate-binding protein n=1 Tax=Kribbella steppae TaxID=2512223 RepID=A0A4R2HDQ6_9ACTN|nr:sugar ABC transporter substrate-binding protein [Kribbella steppae]TCO26154.1 simple sugar transport system substrate-binding protein [Kribbella steppae]